MQNQMRVVPQTLDDLRKEIDAIDDALLELVEARMAATRRVAGLKDAAGDTWLKLRPVREAQVLDRMTARAPGVDPVLIRQLWTALMAHGLQEQARLDFVLHGGGDRLAIQDAVRARFGFAGTLRWVEHEHEAISAAQSGLAVAIVARELPSRDEETGLATFETIPVGDDMLYAIGRIAPDDLQ